MEQPRLFDPGPVEPQKAPRFDASELDFDPRAEYDRGLPPLSGEPRYRDNWLPRPSDDTRRTDGPLGPQFVPTTSLTSNQPRVLTSQVEHLAQYGEDAPPPYARRGRVNGREVFHIQDGNHRANAALRRGQLLTEVDVL